MAPATDGPEASVAAGAVIPIRMDRVFLTFDDEAAEGRFRQEYNRRAATTTRLAITCGAPGYLMLPVILETPRARVVGVAMVGVMAIWVALAWSRLFPRYYNAINLTIESIATALSWVMLFALPPEGSLIVAVAFVTLNFMWIFVFLRPRFPSALTLGVAYLGTVIVGGATIWDRFGDGRAPEGLIPLLAGASGGAMLLTAYAGFLFVLTASVAYRLEHAERVDFLLRGELAAAHELSERLLTNVLPAPVARRLKAGENPIADDLREVSVVFADICGFTELSAALRPAQLLELLNDVFTRFDALATAHGVEKIKTIGDAYMAVAGAPKPVLDHAEVAASMALGMLRVAREVRLPDGSALLVRIGIGSGPAVAGVIGTTKFIYDLWGDTVNTASRMESHGVPGCVQITDRTRELLNGRFPLEDRGIIDVKGKGPLHTWLLRDEGAPTPSSDS